MNVISLMQLSRCHPSSSPGSGLHCPRLGRGGVRGRLNDSGDVCLGRAVYLQGQRGAASPQPHAHGPCVLSVPHRCP